jgi:O-antigen ligase
MKLEKKHLALADRPHLLASVTTVTVTTATFAKAFVPFYLIGSTPIFAATGSFGLVLVSLDWREIRENAGYVTDALLAFVLLYAVAIASYFISSFETVPITHLAGILIFHSLFVLFGFAAARTLMAVYAVLVTQAAVYMIVIAQYTVRYGDLMADGYLHDLFGIGTSSAYVTTFHQQIGNSLALAVLAALGLGLKRIRFTTLAALPFILLFMFHIAARSAMIALVFSLLFWGWANLWQRSKQLALVSVTALVLVAALVSGAFYQYALRDNAVDARAPDAISRTIREIQSKDPGFRLPIWDRTWHRIATDRPDQLIFGRGIGAFPVDEGVGAPDWLLRKTEAAKHYPHNVHLEMLYELGIVGLIVFSLLTILPLAVSLKHWTKFSAPQKAAISLYVVYLVDAEISGAFAYEYVFQFFFGLAIGVIGLKRKEVAEAKLLSSSYFGSHALV